MFWYDCLCSGTCMFFVLTVMIDFIKNVGVWSLSVCVLAFVIIIFDLAYACLCSVICIGFLQLMGETFLHI